MVGTPFHQSYQIAEAIEAALSEAAAGSKTIRPDLIARDLLHRHPTIDLDLPELTTAVSEAATRAKAGLTILAPGLMTSSLIDQSEV